MGGESIVERLNILEKLRTEVNTQKVCLEDLHKRYPSILIEANLLGSLSKRDMTPIEPVNGDEGAKVGREAHTPVGPACEATIKRYNEVNLTYKLVEGILNVLRENNDRYRNASKRLTGE